MSSDLSPQSEQYLADAVQRGVFPSRGAALERAVNLLRQREQLIRDVNEGIEAIERGEYGPLDFDELKARIRREAASRQEAG